MRTLMLSTAALFTVACGGSEAPAPEAEAPAPEPKAAEPPPAAEPAAAAFDAAGVYQTNCAMCHGDAGGGDGVAGAALDPKPRDFKDAAYWGGTDDATVKKAMVEGGAAVGKSPLMAPFGHLFASDGDQDAMVAHLKSFGG